MFLNGFLAFHVVNRSKKAKNKQENEKRSNFSTLLRLREHNIHLISQTSHIKVNRVTLLSSHESLLCLWLQCIKYKVQCIFRCNNGKDSEFKQKSSGSNDLQYIFTLRHELEVEETTRNKQKVALPRELDS